MARKSGKKTQARRQQQLRREALKVRRVEVALSSKKGRDVHISDGLAELQEMTISDYVRQALLEKMVFDGKARRAPETPSEQLEAMYAELNAQREAMVQEFATTPTVDYFEDRFNRLEQQNERLVNMVETLTQIVVELSQREVKVTMAQAVQVETVEPPPTLPEEAPAVVQSSGISMDRPRPRKPLPRSTPPPAEPEPELTDQQQIELAQIMAASIKRAQPGKG